VSNTNKRLRIDLGPFCGIALFLTVPILWAQTLPGAESGRFRLHKFEQEVGAESYTITDELQSLTLKTDFKFTDHRKAVPLTATLRTSRSGAPLSFTMKGRTSVDFEIDSEVTINGRAAAIRQGKDVRTVAAPRTFFTISGYAPAAVQMVMMRYWRAHGSPAELPTLPQGIVRIQDRGREEIDVNGRKVPVERYLIDGLIWGMESVWMDSNNNLAALVSMDAGYDQFEAVREEYEPALSSFVASSARDRMAVLVGRTRKLPGRRTGPFAFVGATLIDGTGRPPVPNATVVTNNGRIVAAGPSASVRIPAEAQRIDVGGKYIIPGLWDMHAHYEQVEWGPLYLAAGVTAVRDLGTELDFIRHVRDDVDGGTGIGPRLLLAGIVDGDPATRAIGMARVNSPEDAGTWVRRYHDAGFQQIKIYSSVKPDNVKAICFEAHKLGMTVTGHIPDGMNAYEGVEDGMDMINHIQYPGDLFWPKDFDQSVLGVERMKVFASVDVSSEAGRRAVEFFKQHGTVIDPTLALVESQMRSTNAPATQTEPGLARISPQLRPAVESESSGMPPSLLPLAQQVFQRLLEIVAAMHRAGVPIVAGTDVTVPGFSIYREIELYVKAGFTPMEALEAATIVPARVMKVDAESGSVEAGKRADLDVLDANPLDNIRNIRTMRMVVANGMLYDPRPLWKNIGFAPE
jgi:imidazolonepropionase-like amidohydrolase